MFPTMVFYRDFPSTWFIMPSGNVGGWYQWLHQVHEFSFSMIKSIISTKYSAIAFNGSIIAEKNMQKLGWL